MFHKLNDFKYVILVLVFVNVNSNKLTVYKDFKNKALRSEITKLTVKC